MPVAGLQRGADRGHCVLRLDQEHAEAELRDLPPADAEEYLAALGLPRLGTDRVIQAGYRALSLISFLTAGEDEVRAWTVARGSKAPTAAGKIHTDFERGFIRAEVVHYDALMANGGSMKVARERGKVRLSMRSIDQQTGEDLEAKQKAEGEGHREAAGE